MDVINKIYIEIRENKKQDNGKSYRIAEGTQVWFQTWSLNPIEASKRTRDGTSSVLFEAEMGFRLNVWNQTSGRVGYLNYTKSVVQEYVSFILFVKKFYSLN